MKAVTNSANSMLDDLDGGTSVMDDLNDLLDNLSDASGDDIDVGGNNTGVGGKDESSDQTQNQNTTEPLEEKTYEQQMKAVTNSANSMLDDLDGDTDVSDDLNDLLDNLSDASSDDIDDGGNNTGVGGKDENSDQNQNQNQMLGNAEMSALKIKDTQKYRDNLADSIASMLDDTDSDDEWNEILSDNDNDDQDDELSTLFDTFEKDSDNDELLSTLFDSGRASPGALTLAELHIRELEDLKALEEALGINIADEEKNNTKNNKKSKEKQSVTDDGVSATRLQAQYRGHAARKSIPNQKKQRQQRQQRQHAAASVQARTRGYLARKKAKEQKEAAVVLQSRIRGKRARNKTLQQKKQMQIRREKYQAIEKQQENTAAISLQSQFRGHQSRRQSSAVKKQQSQAAVHVQSRIRGRQARVRKENMQILRDQREATAVALQARTRGFLARKEAQNQKQAAVVLQSRFRGHHTRKYPLPPPKSLSSSSSLSSSLRIRQPTSPATISPSSASQTNQVRKKRKKSSKKKKKSRNKNSKKEMTTTVTGAAMSPLRSKNPILTPAGTTITTSSFLTKTSSNNEYDIDVPPRTSSLQRSLIGGLGLRTRDIGRGGLSTSNGETSIDWADVRLTNHLYSETESLDALYRPLAMPRLVSSAFEDVVHRIRVLWNQLRYPVAQRSPVAKKMMSSTKENYILLVSHMLLLQAGHRHLLHIVNTIRKDVGEDPVGVGTGSHLTPKRPNMPSPNFSRVGGRGQKLRRKKNKGSNGRKSNSTNRSRNRNRNRNRNSPRLLSSSLRRNNQWGVELSQAISQLKGVSPWIQDFVYRGEVYC